MILSTYDNTPQMSTDLSPASDFGFGTKLTFVWDFISLVFFVLSGFKYQFVSSFCFQAQRFLFFWWKKKELDWRM